MMVIIWRWVKCHLLCEKLVTILFILHTIYILQAKPSEDIYETVNSAADGGGFKKMLLSQKHRSQQWSTWCPSHFHVWPSVFLRGLLFLFTLSLRQRSIFIFAEAPETAKRVCLDPDYRLCPWSFSCSESGMGSENLCLGHIARQCESVGIRTILWLPKSQTTSQFQGPKAPLQYHYFYC